MFPISVFPSLEHPCVVSSPWGAVSLVSWSLSSSLNTFPTVALSISIACPESPSPSLGIEATGHPAACVTPGFSPRHPARRRHHPEQAQLPAAGRSGTGLCQSRWGVSWQRYPSLTLRDSSLLAFSRPKSKLGLAPTESAFAPSQRTLPLPSTHWPWQSCRHLGPLWPWGRLLLQATSQPWALFGISGLSLQAATLLPPQI